MASRLSADGHAPRGHGRRALGLAAAGAGALAAPFLARAAHRTLVDDTGREVRLPASIERVFAAGPPASVAVFALAPRTLIGWPRALRGAERDFVPGFARDLPETGRLTGRGDTTNLETLVAMRPDLVVDVGSVSRTTIDLAERVQQRTGIPYLLLGGRFTETPSMLLRLGEALGAQAGAATLSAHSREVMARFAQPAPRRLRVYYGRGPAGLETGGPGSINVEILEFAGLENVAKGPPSLFAVSPEQLLGWDPDHVVLLDGGLAARLGGDPAWRLLAAVRAGRIHVAPRLPFGWVDFPPGINRLAGLLWIERAILGRGDDASFSAALRRHFALVHHVDIDDAAIARLLAPS